eukprot:c12098_g1_i3.p1 GENE.c12098_g1_i3~~c12098_g1_i3.p1  ORF type:complete len:837 (-),score=211.32 c12098_g1_i3:281-2671(-)
MAEEPTSAASSSFTSRDFSQTIMKVSAAATKASNSLPLGDDFKFSSSYPDFRKRMGDTSSRLVRVMKAITDQQTKSTGSKPIPLTVANADDDDVFESVVDVIDSMLEKVDMCIDEARGVDSKRRVIEQTMAQNKPHVDSMRGPIRAIPRPQLSFANPVDNANTPFVPKPYRSDPKYANLGENERYPHPYQHAIESLRYPDTPRQEQTPQNIPDTPLVMVDTLPLLEQLARDLQEVSEFAVDLEHHNLRSFQGFTCLMQISTRSSDYIVDTLTLRHHISQYLSPLFADPSKMKVMHGADFDVQWLERDFDIYVINLFDTGQASRVLEYPSFGLAYILKHLCDVDVDKKYQLADWRLRPLPADMIEYARSDTHYLLYVYDRMTNLLLEHSDPSKNLLLTAFKNSARVCLTRHERDLWTPQSYAKLYSKNNCNFNEKQLAVFAAVFKWRHLTAREEDESTRYVLPNYMLFNIADAMPTEPLHLVSLCSPPPPLVRIHAPDICRLIVQAKADPAKFLGRPVSNLSAPGENPTSSATTPLTPSKTFTTTAISSTSATNPTNHTTSIPASLSLVDILASASTTAKPLFGSFGRTAKLAHNQQALSIALQSRVRRAQSENTLPPSMAFVADLLPPLKEEQSDCVLARLAKEIKASLTHTPSAMYAAIASSAIPHLTTLPEDSDPATEMRDMEGEVIGDDERAISEMRDADAENLVDFKAAQQQDGGVVDLTNADSTSQNSGSGSDDVSPPPTHPADGQPRILSDVMGKKYKKRSKSEIVLAALQTTSEPDPESQVTPRLRAAR